MASAETDVRAPAEARKLPLTTLTAMVVGSMVGAGVFSLPRNFALATGAFGALIAWVIAGSGMLMLAFVFQTLAVRKPDLDAGVYAYAKAGFGQYLGFFSAFGYWASACIGNVTYWVLISSTLGLLWPGVFGHGDTLAAVALGSAGLWVFHILIARGVQEAAAINKIVTYAKIVPILTFIAVAIFALKAHVFSVNFWGAGPRTASALFGQVRATMLVTVFVFLGIEGASVYSRYAKRRQDVGRATVIGFLGVLALFAAVTIFSYGILSRAELENLRQPSMAGAMQAVVGHWGLVFISVGVIISVLGAYLAWTLMAAEVLFVAAKDRDMPSFLARSSRTSTPVSALVMTSLLTQVMLIVTLFSEDAFTFMLKLCSSLSLIPYLLAAGYALKLGARPDPGDARPIGREVFVAGLATFYTVFLLFAAGVDFLLLSFIIYAPGTVLFVMSRREQNRRIFSPAELIILAVAVAGAVTGIVCLAAGVITI
ncbi:MAG TPA: basic amino acid/polyamine antiporter [Streptosporangiaceae bacterium]|jgi:arginine:ornithine antiporter/lysine permease|nr:basic amino acid/polyamine antiporter [Streptosporangiaceae bacterium]